LEIPVPGDPEEPTIDEVKRVLLIAREVLEAILARLPDDAHP
jgi:hypothetical protein